MRKLRSLAGHSPAIVISLIALTFSLGSGAGYAASTVTSHPAATKITWHKLALKNSWHGVAAGFHAGSPAYTISNGVVYITGVAGRTNQNLPIPSVIGYLPKSARPRHNLWFEAFNYAAGGESTIELESNGAVEIFSGTPTEDQNFFTSLAGIEFPLGS